MALTLREEGLPAKKMECACFDMDGTLIRKTDSGRYLRGLSGNLDALQDVCSCAHALAAEHGWVTKWRHMASPEKSEGRI
jgi:phosphoserine phosphatase